MFYIFLLLFLLLFFLSLLFMFFIKNVFSLSYIKFIIFTFLVEIIFLFLLYFYNGNFLYIFNYYKKSNIIDREEKILAGKVVDNFSKQILLIKQYLEFNSYNHILWWHLGKLYEIQGVYDSSIECLKNAYNICNSDLNLMVNYSLVMAKKLNGNLSDENLFIIKKILEINPVQIEILNLLAIDAYKNRNFSFAKKNWIIILNEIQKNSKNNMFVEILKKKIKELSDY